MRCHIDIALPGLSTDTTKLPSPERLGGAPSLWCVPLSMLGATSTGTTPLLLCRLHSPTSPKHLTWVWPHVLPLSLCPLCQYCSTLVGKSPTRSGPIWTLHSDWSDGVVSLLRARVQSCAAGMSFLAWLPAGVLQQANYWLQLSLGAVSSALPSLDFSLKPT